MLFILASFLLLAPAHAASACKPVHLELYGLQDQGGLNTCYAHVASQLIDARRGPASWPVSAFELALATKESAGTTTPDWGTPCEAFKAARRKGTCAVNQIVAPFSNPAVQERAVHDLAFYATLFKEQDAVGGGRDVVVNSLLYYLRDELRVVAASMPDSQRVRAALESGDTLALLREMAAPTCDLDRRKSAPNAECRELIVRTGPVANRLDALHEALGRGNPVGVTFCLELLKTNLFSDLETCVRHSALAIGRRQRAGRCEILIRNGPATEVWIDAEQLAAQTSSLSYLD